MTTQPPCDHDECPKTRATQTCASCRWWDKEAIKTDPPMNERLCLLSKRTGFGAYGQDGKAIITHATFGCNEWKSDT